MRNSIKLAMLGSVLGLGMLTGPAIAQGGPPPGFTPPPPVAAPLWALDVPFAAKDPILFADLDTSGPAGFTAVIKGGQLCYALSAPGLADPVAAHIHKGGPGENGAPVVPLAAPAGGASGGCVAIDAALAKAMVDNPDGYYVNVHTKTMPGGAERGQLHSKSPGQIWADKNI